MMSTKQTPKQQLSTIELLPCYHEHEAEIEAAIKRREFPYPSRISRLYKEYIRKTGPNEFECLKCDKPFEFDDQPVEQSKANSTSRPRNKSRKPASRTKAISRTPISKPQQKPQKVSTAFVERLLLGSAVDMSGVELSPYERALIEDSSRVFGKAPLEDISADELEIILALCKKSKAEGFGFILGQGCHPSSVDLPTAGNHEFDLKELAARRKRSRITLRPGFKESDAKDLEDALRELLSTAPTYAPRYTSPAPPESSHAPRRLGSAQQVVEYMEELGALPPQVESLPKMAKRGHIDKLTTLSDTYDLDSWIKFN